MQRFDAVLFDVDGTLIDSAPGILYTMREAFTRMGTDVSQVDLARYMGPPLRKTFSEYYTDEAEIERAVTYYRTSYKDKGAHMCSLFPGVKEMLVQLRAAGIPLFTATSKPTVVVVPMLEELGIADFFTEIGGASMGPERDTKTAVIEYILDSHHLRDKKVLMVGDRKDDLVGAANSGLPAVGALYGYGSAAELSPYHPVFLAKDCHELTTYILKGEVL